MKKRKSIQKNGELKKIEKEVEKEVVSFGNRKNVFWPITFATIFLSLVSMPLIIQGEIMLRRFIIIWILQIIYIGMYVVWGERKKKGKKHLKKN